MYEAGGALSPNLTTPPAWYADHYVLQAGADIVKNATSLGFDASDLHASERRKRNIPEPR